MPLFFPDDLDDDFVEGTFAAEWASFTEEVSSAFSEVRDAVVLAAYKAANDVLSAILRASR